MTTPLRIPHCGAWCVNQSFFIWRRALARGLLPTRRDVDEYMHLMHTYTHNELSCDFHLYILGLLWEATNDVQERTAASCFLHVTMDHLIESEFA